MDLGQDTLQSLLDEPTTYLDLTHRIEVLDLLWELNSEEGRTIVMVIQDLNHACRYGHHLVALKGGKIYTQGEPFYMMSQQLVKDVGHTCEWSGLSVSRIPLHFSMPASV